MEMFHFKDLTRLISKPHAALSSFGKRSSEDTLSALGVQFTSR